VDRVDFYLDDASATGTPFSSDSGDPFDFIGTGGGTRQAPWAWSTSGYSDGEHIITARIFETDGDQVVISESFYLV